MILYTLLPNDNSVASLGRASNRSLDHNQLATFINRDNNIQQQSIVRNGADEPATGLHPLGHVREHGTNLLLALERVVHAELE